MQKPGLFGMNGFMVFLLTCLSCAAQAQQQGYMILMDAENKQPFVVRVGDQSYFSSGHGHLVLSQLKDSTYELGLRYPRKNIAEQAFTVAIHRKDLGFLLKGNDSSMVLFNWQTKEIIRPVYGKDSSRILERGIKRDDGFSRLMAAVVNDTAVMYNTYAGNGFSSDSAVANVQSPKPKTQSLTPDVNISGSDKLSVIDQQSAAKNPAAEIPVSVKPTSVAEPGPGVQKSQPSNVNQQPVMVNKDGLLAAKRIQQSSDSLLAVNKEKPFGDSLELASRSTAGVRHSSLTHVKKLRDVSLKISRKMVFLDVGKDGRADTITLFVYFESADTLIKKRPGGEPIALKKPLPPDSTGVKKIHPMNKGSDTTGSGKTAKNRNSDTSSLSKVPLKNNNTDTSGLSKTLVKKNSAKTTDALNCNHAATESDTEALRSAILKANSEQEKIAVAAGAFAIKCFSVSQVRFLASLLVSDKARYGLMDAAHLHIIDRDHFPELVDMLTDKNFQRKFLVMAEKRS